jgi:putative endonuclease
MWQRLIKAAHLVQGAAAERKACRFLESHGLQALQSNYRCRYGELDLIMLDQNTLVIVEVRFRQGHQYGSAAESVTPAKQAKIIAATEHYLQRHGNTRPLRFDVVALSGDGRIDWIKHAF